MPAQITVYKYLCDDCPQLYDSELDCHAHERLTHRHRQDQHLSALKQICTQLTESTIDTDMLGEYERVCETILAMAKTMRTTMAKIELNSDCLGDNVAVSLGDEFLSNQEEIADSNTVFSIKTILNFTAKPIDSVQSPVNPLDKKTFKCTQCDKSYTRIHNLHDHQRLHNGTALTCATCGKQFDKAVKLKDHRISMHTKLRPSS